MTDPFLRAVTAFHEAGHARRGLEAQGADRVREHPP
jgi:hypothetical protein